MGLLSCCGSSFARLTRGAARAAVARLRRLGVGRVEPRWAERAEICERCPLRTVHQGVSYCGQPLLRQVDRQPADGCGCPTRAKARTPGEHCPLDRALRPAIQTPAGCTCRWCR